VARQTERETRDAYLGVMSDVSRVRALQQAVESNRTALRATEAGFEVGTRTTVDVIISQNALLQAETQYAQSRYNYIINVLRLKQAAGTLGVQDIEEVDGWVQ
jgi:outer membrane protein